MCVYSSLHYFHPSIYIVIMYDKIKWLGYNIYLVYYRYIYILVYDSLY